ncbi:hypothetical protein [Streptomyces sp. CCNWLW230]|uniref:hypothetical protein n=1 Tax=Streptomyces sp. CCNWLW230 TaxID=3127464 RepID=UPI003FCFE80D
MAQRFQWQEYGRVGEVAQSALAAFDTACWDLKGKVLVVPVWRLLGGALRRRAPAYANGWYRTERDPWPSPSWPPGSWRAATRA